MSAPTIIVDNLGKRYKIGLRKVGYHTFRDLVVSTVKAPFQRLRALGEKTTKADEFWALRGVSFEVQPGEVVGIIGRNGAGKSTLLKILSRITEPTEGQVEIRGRVGSLLEVGTGFNPELTGRENIYLNGVILGMKKAEIDRKFDEIVAFAEVDKFLDTPVKRYSSGMRVRLAFAVAAHLEPEILIIDEVLAVGDMAFQRKCLGKMEDVAGAGRTVLFVSHNTTAIGSLCSRVILLNSGSIETDGLPDQVIQRYLTTSQTDLVASSAEVRFEASAVGDDSPLVLCAVRVLDEQGKLRDGFSNREAVVIEIEFVLRRKEPTLLVGFELRDSMETIAFLTMHADIENIILGEAHPTGTRRIRTTIPPWLLNGGTYHIDPCIALKGVRWIMKDIRGPSIRILFDVPNPDFIYNRTRPGSLAPMLKWHEVQPSHSSSSGGDATQPTAHFPQGKFV